MEKTTCKKCGEIASIGEKGLCRECQLGIRGKLREHIQHFGHKGLRHRIHRSKKGRHNFFKMKRTSEYKRKKEELRLKDYEKI